MKHLYNMAWGLLLLAGLASCEMKEELSKGGGSGETGVLEIGVAVNKAIDNVATRAGEDDAEEGVGVPVEGDEVAADGFEIDITGEDNFSEQITYNSGETNSISLPAGTYTVYAHTPGVMGRVMDEPYYGGSTDEGTIVITSGVTSTATVKCVIENTRIMLGYDDQFLAAYASWNITIENGSDDQVLSAVYEGTGEPPVIDKYWDLGDGVASVIVKGFAKLKDGGATVPISKVLTKQNGEDFVGAEALNITMVLGSGSTTGTVPSVDVVVDLFGTEPDSNEMVEVPIETEDDDDDPGTPKPPVTEEGAPTVAFPNGESTATFTLPDQAANADATATISTPNGLQRVDVEIIGGNPTFAEIANTMFGGGSFNLVEAENLKTVFEKMGITLPIAGEDTKEYKFPVQSFFGLLQDENLSGGATTDPDGHVFNITVTDMKGETASGSLHVIVK